MDYLPQDPNETDLKTIENNKKKLKEFREFLVDKGVVLALVKVLLSLKYSEEKPKNPIKAIREFFGKYSDNKWEELDALKEEIVILSQENPKLMEKALNLEIEVENAKRMRRIKDIYRSFEFDKNGQIGTKQMIEKLSGNKKFEVDDKLGMPEFIKFIENITENNTEVEKILLEKLEVSLSGGIPFRDDTDSFLYKRIISLLKENKKISLKK